MPNKVLTYQQICALLDKAPGPSPWYLSGRDSQATRGEEALKWERIKDEKPYVGKVNLISELKKESFLILGFHCVVYALPNKNKLLIVYQDSEKKMLCFYLFNVDALKPIENVEKACLEMDETKVSVYFDKGGLEATEDVPLNLPRGQNHFKFKNSFHEITEFLCLADVSKDEPSRTIFSVNPSEDGITVMPQDWFNQGSYDFSYQWITRVMRDPVSGRIYGDGIRLGVFMLDTAGFKVDLWFSNNVFHGPGSTNKLSWRNRILNFSWVKWPGKTKA